MKEHHSVRATKPQLYFMSFIVGILRKSFVSAVVFLKMQLGLSKSEMGVMSSSYSTGYGMSKLIAGLLCDRMSPILVLGIGIILGSIILMLLPYLSGNLLLNTLFLLSGLMFGVCQPTTTKTVVSTFKPEEVGRIWSIIVAFGNMGYSLAPFIFLFLQRYHMNFPFQFNGCLGLALGSSIVIISTSITPSNDNSDSREKTKNSYFQALASSFHNIQMWLMLASSMIGYFALTGFTWINIYLMEYHGATLAQATEIAFWSEVGGVLGTLACGYFSKFIGIQKTCLVFTSLGVPALILMSSNVFTTMTTYKLLLVKVVLFWAVFALNATKTLLPIAVQQSVPIELFGTINGINGIVCQIGAVAAGYMLGLVIDNFGWAVYCYILATSAVLVSLCLAVSVAIGGQTQKVKVS